MTRGRGRLLQRGRVVWISYYGPDPARPGRRKEYRESSRSDDPRVAERLLRQRLVEVHGDRFVPPQQERILVSELLDAHAGHRKLEGRWKSAGKAESQVRRVKDFFGACRVADVTTPALKAWAKARLDEGHARATVKQWLAILRAALRLAHREGRISRLPHFPGIRVRNARRGFFERDQFEAGTKQLAEPWADIARFGYLVGWRLGEILSLRWEWVDRRNGEILLPDSKNEEPRTVPLTGELAALIERRWANRRVGTTIVPLVFHRGGRPIRSFLKRWRTACIKAGLFEVAFVEGKPVKRAAKLFHDIRRTAVRDMIRAGVPETVAMSISGHKTRHVFDRYNISSMRDKRSALAQTAVYRATGTVTDISRTTEQGAG